MSPKGRMEEARMEVRAFLRERMELRRREVEIDRQLYQAVQSLEAEVQQHEEVPA